jgi:hypothetical protein
MDLLRCRHKFHNFTFSHRKEFHKDNEQSVVLLMEDE